MVFSDLRFVFIFLPIFLFIYYLLPHKAKNLFLFCASIVFYTLGTLDRPFYALLLLMAVVVTYYAGIGIEAKPRYKKAILAAALIYHFGLLFLYKYQGFLFSSLNDLFSILHVDINLPILELVLPVGISFYVFQAASYLIDIYRAQIRAEHSFIQFGAYLTMFPQLTAGPIVTYQTVSRELQKRKHSFHDFNEGLKLFVVGLGYKVILANNISGLWKDVNVIGFESISSPLAWMAIIAYSFQLYFDFYGYSLMAKGMGRMMGFSIPDNFKDPYVSISMTEFWRRWHITLSSWFKQYIYIPLGGSRKGKGRTFLNLFAVWAFTGLWHGASLNFLLWGIMLFVIISIEKLGLLKVLEKHRVLGHIYMTFLIPLMWTVFAITDLSQLGIYFLRLFPFLPQDYQAIIPQDYIASLKQYGWLFIVCLILSLPLARKIYVRIKDNIIGALVLSVIFGISIYCLCLGMDDPFLYFRF